MTGQEFTTAAQRLSAIKELIGSHRRGNPPGYDQAQADHVLERVERLLDGWQ